MDEHGSEVCTTELHLTGLALQETGEPYLGLAEF